MFLLLKQQMDYTASYDGTQRGIYLSFLMANLLEGDELYTFIYKQQEISVLLEQVSHKLAAEIPPDLDDIIAQYRYIQVPPSNNPIQDARKRCILCILIHIIQEGTSHETHHFYPIHADPAAIGRRLRRSGPG